MSLGIKTRSSAKDDSSPNEVAQSTDGSTLHSEELWSTISGEMSNIKNYSTNIGISASPESEESTDFFEEKSSIMFSAMNGTEQKNAMNTLRTVEIVMNDTTGLKTFGKKRL